ncbi:hypothetical protein DRJ22_04665 [Candidatus Woesearchaeota archaeon]|nr:MAG: hypothetical protein B6U93_02105 [Candidatus Woesearchaeota archaeon ex4484_78]RLE45310.1 MAG: hypothetical protein DRJ22_04665 [Candidatus Woesearchaeota archaeon]
MTEEKEKEKVKEVHVEKRDFEEFPDPDSAEFLEPEESSEVEEHVNKITVGDEEADVYTEEGREILTEGAEMQPWEEGFSEGASDIGHLAVCAHCGKVLSDNDEEIVERKFNNKIYRFCSEKCAQAGPNLEHEKE